MSSVKPLMYIDFEEIFRYAQREHLDSGEPIPEMNSETAERMKYILELPFKHSFGQVLYWGFYKKLSVLFYTVIKNHALANGNKRMACYLLMGFYDVNDREMKITESQLYELAYFVVNSDASKYDEVLKELKVKLKSYDK